MVLIIWVVGRETGLGWVDGPPRCDEFLLFDIRYSEPLTRLLNQQCGMGAAILYINWYLPYLPRYLAWEGVTEEVASRAAKRRGKCIGELKGLALPLCPA